MENAPVYRNTALTTIGSREVALVSKPIPPKATGNTSLKVTL